MPVFYAVMHVYESEGVQRIAPTPQRAWGMRLQCASCNEEPTGIMYVNETEQHMRGGGQHNFIYKCKLCRTDITVDVLSPPAGTGYYSAVENFPRNIVAAFEVRGGRPVEMEVDNQWVVFTTGGGSFENVDLSLNWYDYDESSQGLVSVGGVKVVLESKR